MNTVPAGGHVQITLPNEMSVRVGSLSCSMIIPATASISSCSANGKIITAVMSTSLPVDAFEMHVLNAVTNPLSTTATSTFSLITYTSSNSIIDQLSQGISLVATSGTMASSSLTPASQIVGATTTLEVRFKPTHDIPVGAYLKVTFPKWNPSASTAQQVEYLQGAISCTTVAVLSASLSCSFTNSILTVTNSAQTLITGGTEVAFSVSGFRNPLSTSSITGFTILIQDSTLGSIDSVSTTALKVSTAATITSATIIVDPATSSAVYGIVQESNKMRLSFNSPVPLNSGCRIKVTLPSQFSVSTVRTVSVFGLFGLQTTITPTVTLADNSFTFTQCTSYTTNTLTAGITIDSMTLPFYTKTSNSLSITISNSNSDVIASVATGVTFTPSPGAFAAPVIVPVTSTVLATTNIKVTLVPTHSIDTTARFTLNIPSAYVLSTSCTLSSLLNINSAAVCTISGQTLTITNLLSTAYVAGSGKQLSFTFSQAKLPPTTQAQTFTATFYVTDSTDSALYMVDQFSGAVTVGINYGAISAKATPSSYIAFDSATYTFEFTPEHQVPYNGVIKVVYPTSVSIADASFSQSQCSTFLNFPTSPTCVINTSTRTITVNNGFRVSSTPAVGTKFSFKMPGIQNPMSLDASDSFAIYSVTSDDQIMDAVSTGLTVQMTSTAYMKSVILTLGSYVNSAVTKYTFQITPTVPVLYQQYVVIQFPTEITVPKDENTYNCYSDDTLIFDQIKCTHHTLIANSVKAELYLRSGVSQINILQSFKITVQSIKNSPTTQPSSAIIVQIANRQFSQLNRNSGTLTVQTNTPKTLSRATLTANNTGAGQYAQYTIVIYPESNITSGGGVQVIYPSQVGVPSTPTATLTSVYTRVTPVVTIDKSARQILLKSAFQQNFLVTTSDQPSITLTLTGFKNPLLNDKSNSFIVRTFNVDSSNTNLYYIDQVSDGLILNSACDYPCNTCTAGKPSNCTSCYTSGDYNKLQGGTCVTACSVGRFFNAATGICETCASTCLACVDSATKCTQCGLGNLLYLYNNVCQSDCPAGYVTDSSKNLCAKCVNNCNTCQFTTSTCTSCYTDKLFPYLFQQSCYSTCPKDVSVDIGNNQCGSCDTTCKTCDKLNTNCTSCLSHMRYDSFRHTCASVCSEGTQIYEPATQACLQCNNNCGTCAGTVNTCTSCNSGQVLNTDNVCRSQCSADNQIAISSVCKQCELPCAQCKTSLNKCTKCQGDYYLYNSTCVQYCPEKFEPNNSTSQCILVGLICPEGFTVNELGDGCIPNDFECAAGYMINQQRTACVPAPGSPVPFPFLFLSVCLGILVIGSHIKDKFFTKPITCLIALIGSQEMLIYVLMVCYAGALNNWGPFVLSLVAVLMQMTANIGFYLIYKKEILNDQNFAKWTRLFPKTQKYLTIIALVVNFKSIKMVYSGFYGLESCLSQFEDPLRNFFRPLRMVTYFSFIFVYIPIIVADILIFANTQWGYQLLVLAIESFLLAILMTVLTIIEFRHPEKLFINSDEQYTQIKPKNFHGETMVMSGLVDMDESTMVRSKVVDEDYEVQLRKKALVSILDQVGKNFLTAQRKGVDLGGHLDQCMTKFDESQLKLRRAFSLEHIREEDSWEAEGNRSASYEEDSDEESEQRRYSYPLTPRTRAQVPDPQFKATLYEIKTATKEIQQDNVYAECKPPDKNKESKRKKTVSRRTQTYLRELLQLEGEDLQESDLEIVMEDEAEIDGDFAKDLIDGVLDGLSDSESQFGLKKKRAKKKKGLNAKRAKEVPDFELADIMGDFEIDDLGNFIILRGEKGELLDKRERRVNRRGYLVDRFGNVINKQGQIIFKAVELDSDDEIPAPFGFEKRKKNLLNLGQGGEFKVEGNDNQVNDDEDLIERELKQMKKSGRRKRKRQMADGQIIEEDGDDDESSIDSLMAESPGKYQIDSNANNEDDIIDRVTKKKIPKKRPPNYKQKKPSPHRGRNEDSPEETSRKKNAAPLQNLPPKRIKREDTREMFPSLAIESIEQKKLFKIAEHIGGMANQIADTQKKSQDLNAQQAQMNQERLERLKQEHFKDILNESQLKQQQTAARPNHQGEKLPPRPPLEKVYGNLNDVVSYEERLIQEQMKTGNGARAQSPFSSVMTSRLGQRHESSTIGPGGNRRMRGLESIYLQKFDKKANSGMRKQAKAKFRNTLNQFVDDPELLVDDGIDMHRQNEMSLMVADKLDRLQKQYMSSTATNKFSNLPITSMGFANVPSSAGGGGHFSKKAGSVSGSMLNQDLSLEPIKKGNWVKRD